MRIKTNVTDIKVISLHSGVAVKYISQESLRWFLGIALRIPTAHDFRVISTRKWARARIRDFPQTKLDGELNSPFLLNELGDPRIFFQVFTENSLIKNIF